MRTYEGLTHEEYISKFGCQIQRYAPHTLSDVAAEKAVVDEKAKAEIGQAKVIKANDSKPNL